MIPSFFLWMTSRRWSFTLNNYTSEELQALLSLGETIPSQSVRYLILGRETGEQGTPHIQGYVEFVKTTRLSGCKRLLGNRIHGEIARGTGEQNKTYCSKENNFSEFGTLRKCNQGKRNDLLLIKERIADGATDLELANDFFGDWVRYRASFQAFRTLLNRPSVTPSYELSSFPEDWQDIAADFKEDRHWDSSLIFWGDSGIGKTEFACALLPGSLMVSHMDDLSKFDPSIHTGIIFDDVDIKHFPRTSQIHLLDWTQDRSIHIRYNTAFIPKNTKKIFTTNEFNGMCCDREDKAIERRTTVFHLTK